MKVTRKSRWQVRIHNLLFVVLFLGVIASLAWLSTRYAFEADWTAGQRNTLTEDTRTLVGGMDGPVTVTVFMRDGHPGRRQAREMIARYRDVKDDIELEIVNPDTDPERVRRAGIGAEGEVVVAYRDRSERIGEMSERGLTNALQRLERGGERWVVFIEGHGERDPRGQANHDYGVLGAELERKGLKVQTVNPLAQGAIPDNTSLLVVAGPQVDLLPAAVEMLVEWVAGGGNLAWFADPGPMHGLEPLAEELGIGFAGGEVVDSTARMFGIDDPAMVIVADYAPHPVTRDFSVITLFPRATAIEHDMVPDAWRVEPLLTTLPRSRLSATPGPHDIGITMTRPAGEGGQRVAVVGDGDFLSNAYLNNGGNLDLGLNLVNWLVLDDAQINIHLRSAPDLTLSLSRTAFYAISMTSLIFLPLLLVGCGVFIWWRRRRR